MSSVFDVIVVGAGPGGSNTAAVALRNGLSVAQVEKFKFPRVKPCAGALTIKSCNSLQLDLASTLRSEFKEFEFNVWHARHNRFAHCRSPILRMVLRPEFDNWLVTQNLKSPRFRFFDEERVIDVAYDGIFKVRTSKRTLLGYNLVGADGAYSAVNRIFKISQPKGYALAAEVNLSRTTARVKAEIPPSFDFGVVEKGYGWVFPKDDHWSVGIYTLKPTKEIRQQLTKYIVDKGFTFEGDPLETFEAHEFPYGGYRLSIPEIPVYIVGDAGGFGDAITGEGIYHALESGRIAGEVISRKLAGRQGPALYYKSLRRSVLVDTFLTYQISREFYRDVNKALTILENTLVWRPLVQGYTEGATFSQSIKKGGWLLVKSFLFRTLRYRRDGLSLPFSLSGGLRGIRFLTEPLLRRLQSGKTG